MKPSIAPLALAWIFSSLAALGAAQGGNPGSPAPPPGGGAPPPAAPVPPVGPPAETAASGNDSDTNERDGAAQGGGLPPGLVKLLRRGQSQSGQAPPAGPKSPGPRSAPPGDWNGPRGWELWWELHRDRYIRTPQRDVTFAASQVPPDPRTSVQVEGTRFGSYERIEPSLRLLLAHERSELVVSRALVSLAKLGEDPRIRGSRKAYAAILPFLHHADAQLSEAAITALGILGTEDALFPLGDIAEGARARGGSARSRSGPSSTIASATFEPTDRQRALALYAMGLIGRDSLREDVRRLAASRICRIFSQEANASAEIKFAALHALSLVPIRVESPSPTAGSQVKARKNRGFGARHSQRPTAPAIPSASRAAEVDWALSVLDDEGEAGWIRAQAVTAAARLCAGLEDGSPIERKVIERLLNALAPRSPDCVEIEQSAALALGELGDADSDELDARLRRALAATFEDASDQSTREFALLSLALVGSRPGGEIGEADRLSASGDVRRLLLHRAAGARSGELPWTVLALGVFEHGMRGASGASARETRAALADLLSETHSAEHAAACSLALGLCGGGEGNSELISRLRDGDPWIRSYAALALGMVGAREAAPALERTLSEARSSPELYRSASEALAMLGAPVSRQLVGMMVGGASLESQMNLCTALGRVGDSRSLHALSQVACDTGTLVWVRAAATSALGTMGSRRREAWNADLGHALNYLSLPPTLSATSLDGLLDLE